MLDGPLSELHFEELQNELTQTRTELATATARLTTTTAQLTEVTTKLSEVETERDNLRNAYQRTLEQLRLLERRIFVAKAERIDYRQLEMEFQATQKELDALASQLEAAEAGRADDHADNADAADNADPQAQLGSRPSGKKPPKKGSKPKGRRNLATADMPEQRIELTDPELEGKAEHIGWEESYKLGRQKPGPVRIVIARAKYKVSDTEANSDAKPDSDCEGDKVTIKTAPLPRSLLRRSILAPSMLAHIIACKFRFGMPYYRQEKMLAADGIDLDRGSMARSVEDAGASLGEVVLACAAYAKENAFCLSTDATGIAIQPEPLPDGGRQPCRKGHFFVVLADKDHIFFEFQPKHTSAAVCDMFRGFSGFIQADAHSIYNAVFRGEAVDDPADAPLEVACWAHARRRFWEAAVSGYSIGKQGLLRIRKLYELDQSWKKQPPSMRKKKRQDILKPLVDDFFSWVQEQYLLVEKQRGLVRQALGYAVRQEQALRRFLEDGRLKIDNTAAEREIKPIATGRKNWLFFGSDDHASAAANLLSLIASAKLHSIEPEQYLAELIHVMPYWPRERYLELAPFRWKQTRARLDSDELSREVGPITVPPPLSDSAEQKPSS